MFLFSTLFHLFCPLSDATYKVLLKLDFIAIGVNICGLTLAIGAAAFEANPTPRLYLLGSISGVFIVNLVA